MPSAIQASCDPTANPLRWACHVTVDPPQPVDIAFGLDGAAQEHTLSSEAELAEHDIVLFLMKPERDYTWRATARRDPAAEATGGFTTGALSGGCLLDIGTTGTSSAPYFVLQSPCSTDANVVVIDADGDVVWCEDFSPAGSDPLIEGTSLTEDMTVIAVVADTILEKDFAGNELLRLSRGVDFSPHVHHDVFRKDGLTYVLFNEQVSWQSANYTLDGFFVFDGPQLLGEWHLFDHFQPAGGVGFPGSDYSHANAIWTDGSGLGMVSFRHLSAIANIVFDTTSPDFGQIVWRLSGDGPLPEFGTDFALSSSIGADPSFERQHNVHLLPTGRLAMFDNRAGFADPSRLLHLDLDLGAQTADITAEYRLPQHCDFQGGAWHTEAGNPVATCAPARLGTEFDAVSGDVVWEIDANCATGFGSYIPRFIPWQGPW